MSKADDIFWREFGVVLMALVLFTVIVFFTARAIGSHTFEQMRNTPQAVLERIQPIGQVRVGEPGEVVASAAPAAAATEPAAEPAAADGGDAQSGEQVYNGVCMACHTAGVAGAPKLGDTAVWETRLAQGMDTLVGSSINGKGAMPPRGGNPKLSDAEIRNAVEYMLEQAGLAEAGGAASAATAEPAKEQAEAKAEPEKPEAEASAAETTAAAAGADGEAVYGKACVACHSTGVAGAPKLGDTAAWETRLAQGMDVLFNSSIKGKGAMPPKGGYVSLSDADVKSAVRYMLRESGLEPG